MMFPFQWIIEAKSRISTQVKITPITYDEAYDLYLKWENHQVTGSFKMRGAFNKILGLEKWEQEAGLLTASAGNHGQGIAFAGKFVGAPVKVFASENASQVKIDAIRSFGADVILVPGGYGEAEKEALDLASKTDLTWISPYNDGQIIAGQGTIALEIIDQLATYPKFQIEDSVWLVPTSGGGLLAGVSAVIKTLSPKSKVVGVQTNTNPFMSAIFHKGTQKGEVELPTIADGLAGPVEENSITIPIVRNYVDDIILVTEAEIANAVAFAWYRYGERVEGAAAVSLAAILTKKIYNGPIVAILTGGNIQREVFDDIIHSQVKK
jgi:threonine dehydratase